MHALFLWTRENTLLSVALSVDRYIAIYILVWTFESLVIHISQRETRN